jgi:hypothetical protein
MLFVDEGFQLLPQRIWPSQNWERIRATISRNCLQAVFGTYDDGLGERAGKGGFTQAAIATDGDDHRAVSGFADRGQNAHWHSPFLQRVDDMLNLRQLSIALSAH